MEAACGTLDRLFTELADIALDSLSASELGSFAVVLGCGIDRLTAFHARVVRAADERRVWAGSGARDMDEFLSQRTGTSRGTAASRRKLGEALAQSASLDLAVTTGELSAEAATQLHDAVTNPPAGAVESDVDDLIDAAKGSGPRDVRAAADRWRELCSDQHPAERARRRHEARSLTSRPVSGGLVESLLVLPVLEHRQVMNTINHAAGSYHPDDGRTVAQRMADGLINLTNAYASGTVTGGREKPTIIVGCTAETITGISDEPGWTAHGDQIPAHDIRHLAENAIIRRIITAGSVIIDLGKRVRYASDDQYQALIWRDGGCRYPGCDIPAAWCEIDHLTPAEHDGPTDLANLVLWCNFHHHYKHRHDVHVIGDAHDLHLQLPDGQLLTCPPPNRPTQAAA